MELKPESLLIFLLAILPGAVAQRAKSSLVPRSLETPTAVSEVGDYVLTSAWIHVATLLLFRTILLCTMGENYSVSIMKQIQQAGLERGFFIDHWKLVCAYFLIMVVGAYFFGILRGYQIRTKRFQRSLFKKLGLTVALEQRTLWSVVMDGDRAEDADTWLEVELKDDKGFYQGRLKTYPIVAESERNKEFYLKPAKFKEKRSDKYLPLPEGSGVLLTFCEVVSMRVARVARSQPAQTAKAAAAGSISSATTSTPAGNVL